MATSFEDKNSCDKTGNLGTYLAKRMVEYGVKDYFAVPGDYNLVLLDQLLLESRLKMIGCANELNAGYAADGYARVKGVGVLVVTFTVGGLSAINAVAGAYSDNLPLVVISGCPNSNDYGTERILHHTVGLPNFNQTFRCFQNVTCHCCIIKSIENAAREIDYAFEMAIKMKKPVYIEISCNLPAIKHYSFMDPPPMCGFPKQSNQDVLDKVAKDIVDMLKGAVKPVLVVGPNIRKCHAQDAFQKLADACGYAYACLPNAKGMVSEEHDHFIGTYWGQVSSPFCCEIIESADMYIFIGPIFNDYTTVGYSTLIKPEKMITIDRKEVELCGRKRYHGITMADVLNEVAKIIPRNEASFTNYSRMFVPSGIPPAVGKEGPLMTNVLMHHIQSIISKDNAIIAETGDSWFNGQKLNLPDGALYEFQMQYGSIGWAVGATLGMCSALHGKKRVISLIGDGSFQVTCQEISTIIRNEYNPIVFLINNDGYTIEVEIHDGPYNNIQAWDYCKLVEAFAGENSKAYTYKVTTEKEAKDAISKAMERTDAINFIECIIARDDCSKELLEWGSRVAAANGRPPNPQ